ncbi:hypothetical protein [Streptomyces sp. NPDC056491]|uniref:hypothetical protein n=1 Tax=Streptomyces sp. NPDC056491 TaxID=3345837 RepID=UPI00369FB371
MPGHPVHPVQPAQPTQSVRSLHDADAVPRFTPSPRSPLHPSGRRGGHPHDDPAGDVVRWAAFSCLLVPVVLVVYGTSFGGAAVATLGLLAVTAACRVLLRHSERTAARVRAQEPLAPVGRRRHSRGGAGMRRSCRGSDPASPHD